MTDTACANKPSPSSPAIGDVERQLRKENENETQERRTIQSERSGDEAQGGNLCEPDTPGLFSGGSGQGWLRCRSPEAQGDVEKLIERLNHCIEQDDWCIEQRTLEVLKDAAAMLRSLADERAKGAMTDVEKLIEAWDTASCADARMTVASQSAGDDLIKAIRALAAEKAKVEEAWTEERATANHYLDEMASLRAKLECAEDMLRESDKLAAETNAKLERAREALQLCYYALSGADQLFNVNAATDKARATLEELK